MRPHAPRVLAIALTLVVAACSSSPPGSGEGSPATTLPTPSSPAAPPSSAASPSLEAASAGASIIPTASASAAGPTSGAAKGAPSPSGSPTPGPTVAPSAWQTELADVGPDGSRTLDSALRLFAIAFGPLPGVDAPPDRHGVTDATVAVDAVRRVDAQLTPDQRGAVAGLLAPAPDAERFDVGPVGSVSVAPAAFVAPRASVSPDLDKAIRDAAVKDRAAIAGKLGGDIPGPIHIVLGAAPSTAYIGFAAGDWSGPGDSYVGCSVTLTTELTNGEPTEILNTLVHEVLHCFQHAAYHFASVDERAPDWVVEGSSEWAGGDLGAPDANDFNWWARYLAQPHTPLFARSYDAIGFYAHLKETGTDPWTVLEAMYKAVDSVPAFTASGATNDQFLDSWASGLTRDPARGRAWDTTGPSITDDSAPVEPSSFANGTTSTFTIDAYTEGDYALFVSADVLAVSAAGHARLSDAHVDTADLGIAYFCTRQGGCQTCPDGTALPVPPAPLATDPVLAITGGPAGASVSVAGLSLDDLCRTGRGVWVHLERPAQGVALAGRVLDIVSCTGPFGTWTGAVRAGGLNVDGHVLPFNEMPISFAMTGGQGHGTASGQIATFDVSYDLTIRVEADGRQMTISGTGRASNQFLDLSTLLGGMPVIVPIEPAPAGRCP